MARMALFFFRKVNAMAVTGIVQDIYDVVSLRGGSLSPANRFCQSTLP
ncbi:hypothetical protein ART_0615 [Arthrobacter sp. PAMC 25486]|nr:hypothetical protein ART_0615 [Arthrobacter sp. PAMC 25486]